MFWVSDPITLDKSESWGEGNIQQHKKGCWIQLKEKTLKGVSEISHLVAGDSKNPVGWEPRITGEYVTDLWVKLPIMAKQISEKNVILDTLDGTMSYDNPDGDGWIAFNLNKDGTRNENDSWFIKNEDFIEMYKEV